jgi:hypothetical protein
MDIIAKYTEAEAAEINGCINCGEEVHTPDDRTGEIHKNGLYACYTLKNGKTVRLSTVAKGN